MRPIQCVKLADCPRYDGHPGRCGFEREPQVDGWLSQPTIEVVTDRSAIELALADVEDVPLAVTEPAMFRDTAVDFWVRTTQGPVKVTNGPFVTVALPQSWPSASHHAITPLGSAIAAVLAERERHDELKAAGRFLHTIADAEMADADRLAALVEEIGEVARALQERSGSVNDRRGSDVDLRKELSQVAAIAVGWIERLDADAGTAP